MKAIIGELCLVSRSDALVAGMLPQPYLPLWATALLLRDTLWEQGETPLETADKTFCTAQAAGASQQWPLGAPRELLPSDTAHFPQPTADPHRSHGEKGASSSRACGKPGITSPNLAEGCPEEKMLLYTLLETMTWCCSKIAKGPSRPFYRIIPTCARHRRGDFYSLSFKS